MVLEVAQDFDLHETRWHDPADVMSSKLPDISLSCSPLKTASGLLRRRSSQAHGIS